MKIKSKYWTNVIFVIFNGNISINNEYAFKNVSEMKQMCVSSGLKSQNPICPQTTTNVLPIFIFYRSKSTILVTVSFYAQYNERPPGISIKNRNEKLNFSPRMYVIFFYPYYTYWIFVSRFLHFDHLLRIVFKFEFFANPN